MRKIPHVPKEERYNTDVGYHNIPSWLIISVFIILFGAICLFLFT